MTFNTMTITNGKKIIFVIAGKIFFDNSNVLIVFFVLFTVETNVSEGVDVADFFGDFINVVIIELEKLAGNGGGLAADFFLNGGGIVIIIIEIDVVIIEGVIGGRFGV
jgi:hypothetical protein